MFKDNFYIYYDANSKQFILVNADDQEKYILDEEKFFTMLYRQEYLKEFDEIGIIKHKDDVKAQLKLPIQFKIAKNLIYHGREFIFQDMNLMEYYVENCDQVIKNFILPKEKETLQKINLPKPEEIQGQFYDLLKKRKTIREFKYEFVDLQKLANLLFIAYGKFHEGYGNELMDKHQLSWRRSSPSGGSMQSINAYIYIFRVKGIENGIYYYHPTKHQLFLIKLGDFEQELSQYFSAQDFYLGSAFIIMNVSNVFKMIQKYPDNTKNFFVPFLDSGHISQTAILSAVAMNMQYWISAIMCDEYFNRELKLNEYEYVTQYTAFGYGYDDPIGPTKMKELKKQ